MLEREPKSGTKRAIRRGIFTSPKTLVRASFRVGRTPTDVSDGQGFRCARE